jgi:glycosyltransferase involved in cell wall biosynthesis
MLLHFADADLENTVFAAADAVWIAYKGHSTMSGVFYQAACCGLPVIAPDYGILNLLTAQHGAGISVDPDNPEETGRQLQELLCDGDNREGLSQNLANIAELHFPENFGRSVCDAILEAAAA